MVFRRRRRCRLFRRKTSFQFLSFEFTRKLRTNVNETKNVKKKTNEKNDISRSLSVFGIHLHRKIKNGSSNAAAQLPEDWLVFLMHLRIKKNVYERKISCYCDSPRQKDKLHLTCSQENVAVHCNVDRIHEQHAISFNRWRSFSVRLTVRSSIFRYIEQCKRCSVRLGRPFAELTHAATNEQSNNQPNETLFNVTFSFVFLLHVPLICSSLKLLSEKFKWVSSCVRDDSLAEVLFPITAGCTPFLFHP